MQTLNLNSITFRSIDQNFRITLSWDKTTLPNLSFNQEAAIADIKIYELDDEQIEFARKYHIPFKHTYYSLDEINKFILLLEQYEEFIIEAEALKLSWDFDRFDFEGLKELVEKEIEKRKDIKESSGE